MAIVLPSIIQADADCVPGSGGIMESRISVARMTGLRHKLQTPDRSSYLKALHRVRSSSIQGENLHMTLRAISTTRNLQNK